MIDKEPFGFFTEASRLQRQYEETIAKVNKTKQDWVSIRSNSTTFLKDVVAGLESVMKVNPSSSATVLIGTGLKEIARTQILVCDLGTYMCDVESRLVELEKTINNLSLKIK